MRSSLHLSPIGIDACCDANVEKNHETFGVTNGSYPESFLNLDYTTALILYRIWTDFQDSGMIDIILVGVVVLETSGACRTYDPGKAWKQGLQDGPQSGNSSLSGLV